MTLDRDHALRVQLDFTRAFLRWLGGASPGAEAWKAPGITAAVVPAAPERSIVNSMLAEDADALEASYDELASAYAEAGVEAWIGWVPDSDQRSAAFLRERGHEPDGEPVAMTLELRALRSIESGDLDWDARAGWDEFGSINDLAYGHEPHDGIARAIRGAGGEGTLRLYRARAGGEVASVLGVLDVGTDAGVLFVATDPRCQGRGLASRLLSVALEEARERGMETSSLQASERGSPVYARLGYEPFFRFLLLERRRHA